MKQILTFIAVLVASVTSWAAPVDSTAVAPARCDVGYSVTSAVTGLAVNAGVTEILKHSVREWRPDGSDRHSFPSRHASYAFALANIAVHELTPYSSYWAIGAHTAANVIAMQRTFGAHHYPSDVLAGAAIGIASSELGYALAGLILGRHPRLTFYVADSRESLQSATTALIAFNSHSRGLKLGTGIESSLRLTAPLSDSFGLGISAALRSRPVYFGGLCSGMLNQAGFRLDAYYFTPLGVYSPWAADFRVAAGALYAIDRPMSIVPRWSPMLLLDAGLMCRIGRRFSLGARVGWETSRIYEASDSSPSLMSVSLCCTAAI